MTHRHTLLVVSVAVAMLVAPTILAQETGTATRNATNESETAGMGTQLTAFTQSSSSAVNDSVENGMWKAGFNQSNASERARLVRDRAGTLEERLARLQQENASLRDSHENGTVAEPAYIARQSRLSARIDALRAAINDTDDAAARAGVNDSRLERLRRNASELKGPEVAAIARGLGGGPPEDRGPPADRGQPADRGPSEDRSQPADRGPPAERGQPADRAPSENRGERGQSADAGDSEQSVNGTNGPPANRTEGAGSGGGNATDGTADAGNGTSSDDGSETTDGGSGSSGGQRGGAADDGSGTTGGQADDGSDNTGGQADDAPGRSGN